MQPNLGQSPQKAPHESGWRIGGTTTRPPVPVSPLYVAEGEPSDSELIARCTERDEAAWSTLIDRYHGLVFSVALEVGLDEDDASDVYQYVWTELHQSLPRLRSAVALPRWLMVAARRHSYKVATQRRRAVHDTFESMADPKALSDEQVAAAQDRLTIESSLRRLDEKCRSLIHLLFFSSEKLSYQDISERANLAIGSIGPTRARCLEKLRRKIRRRP